MNNMTISYQRHPVVHHLSVSFPKGKATAIIGPNGAGKSTLLKAIMGFLKPEEGDVSYNIDQSSISYLPQQSEINRDLPITVEELVAMGSLKANSLFNKVAHSHHQKVQDALAYVGLKGFENRQIEALSNGQFQRALFARIMVQDCDLILLDEPFNAIDAKTIADLCQLIQSWVKAGKTVIAVIHDFYMAKLQFEYTLLMARSLIDFGKTEDVLREENIDKAYSTILYWDENAEVCDTPL